MIDLARLKAPQLLNKSHIRNNFDCSEEALNVFLQKYAMQNSKNNVSRTYVSIDGSNDEVVGYYTLTYGAISHLEATEKIRKNMPNYPIPVIILARLAVDKSCQFMGLGSALLKDAILRTLQAAEIAGLKAIVAQAKNKQAASFYKKYGFEESIIDEFHLMLAIQDIHSSLVNI